MAGEGRTQDYKLTFDPNDAKAKVDLVKNLVAMANAGGGQIIFGCDETTKPGIDTKTCQALDSARLADFIQNFIAPAQVNLSHAMQELDNGRYLLTVQVNAVDHPLVMAKQGDWKGRDSKSEKSLFLVGDIWIRHSSKTERVTFEDIRTWIERAKESEREKLLKRLTTLVNLPEGAEIQVVSAEQAPIDSPERLLEYATLRHEYDSSHLLTSKDLAWLFSNRSELPTISDDQLRLLISSALRRPPTLYWWLLAADQQPKMIIEEIQKCLDASDRDKSDAAKSVIEVAAIYADDETLKTVLADLQKSRYKHFRDAAADWNGRRIELGKAQSRIQSARLDGEQLLDLDTDALEQLATELSVELINNTKPATSRKLADVTRVLWHHRSAFSHVLGNP